MQDINEYAPKRLIFHLCQQTNRNKIKNMNDLRCLFFVVLFFPTSISHTRTFFLFIFFLLKHPNIHLFLTTPFLCEVKEKKGAFARSADPDGISDTDEWLMAVDSPLARM